jgi:prevent-host-death family protein
LIASVDMMTTTTLSSRQFNQDVSRAKRAANDGPVIITDRGEPAYVLLKHDDYRRLAGDEPSIRDLLDQPGVEDIDFDPPRLGDGIFRPASLT